MTARELHLHDLRARRHNAGVRPKEMARRLGIDLLAFEALEMGAVPVVGELDKAWKREIERAEEQFVDGSGLRGLPRFLHWLRQ